MDETTAIEWAVFLWVVIGAGVGAILGSVKKRAGEGGYIGAFLGVIGWVVIIYAFDDLGRKCPECLGVVPDGAKKCKHCGSELPLPPSQQPAAAPPAIPKAAAPRTEPYKFPCAVCDHPLEMPVNVLPCDFLCPRCQSPVS